MKLLLPIPVLLSLFACHAGGSHSRSADVAVTQAIVKVDLVNPIEVAVPVDVQASGQIVSDHSARVAAGTMGRLVSVSAERGQAVRKGEVIAAVDDRVLRATLDQARASLAQAQANERTLVDEAARAKALFEQKLSNAAALQRAEAQAAAATATTAAARAAVQAAEVRAGDARIKAPFDGVVAARLVSPGEYVRDDMPVVELVGTEGLRVQITLGEREAARVAGGEQIRFRVLGDTEDRMATVDRVAPSFRAGSRDLVIEALVDPADGEGLRPNAFIEARVSTGERPVLSVPAAAVRTTGVVSRVYVAADGQLEERIVPIGPEVDGRIVVLDGLKPGDRIASDAEGLSDGARIGG